MRRIRAKKEKMRTSFALASLEEASLTFPEGPRRKE
jgi:hypothetical protein